jgi:hypothetical protein
MFVCCVNVWRRLAAALLASGLAAAGAKAQVNPFSLAEPSEGSFLTDRADMSSGFDASGQSWSAYSTAVLSPLGPLHQDGLRLKLTGSYSAWSYDTTRPLPYCMMSKQEREQATGTNLADLCNDLANRTLTPDEQAAINRSIKPSGLQIDGEQFYLTRAYQAQRFEMAVMPGIQAGWRALVVKAYLGPAMESQTVLPGDPDKASSGAVWGARGAIETWMRLSDAFWISADGGYFTGSERYSAMLRVGYQPLD